MPCAMVNAANLHIEEDANSFGSHFSHPAWPCVFKIKLPLRNGLWRNNVPLHMFLYGIRNTDLQFMSVQAADIIAGVIRSPLGVRCRHFELSVVDPKCG